LEIEKQGFRYCASAIISYPVSTPRGGWKTGKLNSVSQNNCGKLWETEKLKGAKMENQTEQHIYHHGEVHEPRIGIKVEKNSRGTNVEISISDARSADEAVALYRKVKEQLLNEIEKETSTQPA
jgi:hypothetical protein